MSLELNFSARAQQDRSCIATFEYAFQFDAVIVLIPTFDISGIYVKNLLVAINVTENDTTLRSSAVFLAVQYLADTSIPERTREIGALDLTPVFDLADTKFEFLVYSCSQFFDLERSSIPVDYRDSDCGVPFIVFFVGSSSRVDLWFRISHQVVCLALLLGELFSHHRYSQKGAKKGRPPAQRAHPRRYAVFGRTANEDLSTRTSDNEQSSYPDDHRRSEPSDDVVGSTKIHGSPRQLDGELIISRRELQCASPVEMEGQPNG